MARKPKLYQKLARRRGGVGTYFSLWLAADHVLQVEANLMTERYQRVWFRDIQGFILRPSRVAKTLSWTSLAVLVLMGAAATIADTMMPLVITVMVAAGLFLLYGLLAARNCHFHVQTAVQQIEWKNLARFGRARKVIARLEPLLLEAQREMASPVVESAQGNATGEASAGLSGAERPASTPVSPS